VKVKGVKHYESKVMPRFSMGGSVQRSESTESAKADREYTDRKAEAKAAVKNMKTDQSNQDFRSASALADRAVRRMGNAGDRASATSERTGYYGMGKDADDTGLPSDRLGRSPVDIGKDDD
jgi:hypothetical protein